MSQEITVRNIPPTLTLTHVEKCTSLSHGIASLHFETKLNAKGSFICQLDQPYLIDGGEIQVFCLVENSNYHVDSKAFAYKVVQRERVLSTIHKGGYDSIQESFLRLEEYLAEHGLQSLHAYRLVVHKEKRKWQRDKFLKKAEKEEYITEVQILIKQEEEAPVEENTPKTT